MDHELLIEYRCDCGKLLFKGIMLVAVVEIKCKRCGKMVAFKKLFSRQIPGFFALTVSESGVITDACLDAETLCEYPRMEFLGKPIADICPALRDAEEQKEMYDSLATHGAYKIKNNVFLVRDGCTISPESYCVSRYKNGVPAGYRIFNWLADIHHGKET